MENSKTKYYVDNTDKFDKELRKLIKKFPSIYDKVNELIHDLQNGIIQGEDLQNMKIPNNKVFKLRLPNPDANKGKRGGFRIIYYLITRDKEIYLLTIYSKSEKDNITNKEITAIIESYLADEPEESLDQSKI